MYTDEDHTVVSLLGDWECYPHDPTVWHVSLILCFQNRHLPTVSLLSLYFIEMTDIKSV